MGIQAVGKWPQTLSRLASPSPKPIPFLALPSPGTLAAPDLAVTSGHLSPQSSLGGCQPLTTGTLLGTQELWSLPCKIVPGPWSLGCHGLPSVPSERLRLADGPHGCAGRLEVRHSGHWGTVCDDGWDLRDAAVACWDLGCGGALAAPRGAFFGEGTGPVWLSELACRGSEGQLRLCPHRGWKAHVCSHEEDAGVVCAGEDPESAPSLRGAEGLPPGP